MAPASARDNMFLSSITPSGVSLITRTRGFLILMAFIAVLVTRLSATPDDIFARVVREHGTIATPLVLMR